MIISLLSKDFHADIYARLGKSGLKVSKIILGVGLVEALTALFMISHELLIKRHVMDRLCYPRAAVLTPMNIQTMSYGSPHEWEDWVLDEEKSLPLLEHAYKVGINTWDTVSSPYVAIATTVLPVLSLIHI